tara:strand:- start:3178 stop:4917 length:1740 start_codon:yes stop_codon:yes gene_type:complete
MERWKHDVINHKELIEKRSKIEKEIKDWKKKSDLDVVYNIPVVFHIIYENENENISIEQIQSQLNVLNEDFNRMNSDANQTPDDFVDIAANCNINFCLARRNPSNDSTTGVTYTQTAISSFSLYDNRIFHDSLGGKNIWNPKKFLNIYVCDLNNALGFSSFPGGLESRDAIVINYTNFGTINLSPPFNKGRTATHELGHWLNLLHIWGDGNCGNDQVEDTPVQNNENYGCPIHPSPTCNNNGDMFQNFMDYTDDACMNLFTEGQKDRMHATLNLQRSEIIQSKGCSYPYEDIGINENISPVNNQEYCGYNIELITSLFNYSNSNINKSNIYFKIDDQEIQMIEWNGNLLPNSSEEVNLGAFSLTAGEHSLLIYSSLPNGFSDLNRMNDTLLINFSIVDGTPLNFNIQADNYAEENSWEIINTNDEIIVSNDNIISNQLNTFSYCQEIDSCYSLVVYDDYGDGICCDFGNGYISINNQIYDGDFNSEIEIDLCSISSLNASTKENLIVIYPNPSYGRLIIKSEMHINKIQVLDITGKIILEKNCNSKIETLNLYNSEKAPYFVYVTTKNKFTYHKKIIIQ